jgi:two-component system cell cycle response regulator DivK
MTGARILIVDDNLVNLKLAQLTLRVEGYEVKTAVDAPDAMAVMADFHPRLILMDIQLPGIDGLELTRRLKAAPATQDILILALTAYAMVGDEARMMAAGCDGYIPKPIDTQTLAGIVASYLNGASMEVGTKD